VTKWQSFKRSLATRKLSHSNFGETASAPLCQAPDANLRSSKIVLPEGATDCHAHICGPASVYPYWSERIYTPPDALLPTYRNLLQSLGVSRAVIVQPSVYADDNRALLDVLATDLVNLRGVAVAKASISDNELERWHAAGVRGLRCNIVDLASAKGSLPIAELRELAQRIAPLSWHLELLMHVNEFSDLQVQLGDLPVDLVFGHFGYLPCWLGVADRGFQNLLAMLREGTAWVKFTGPYRISGLPSYSDVSALAHALVGANPKRLLWGTDWPHVMVKGQMPNDADLCDLLGDWISDFEVLNQVLVRNPAALYGFPD
jgi:2-pyrone-4,6-dicarboxylate lactonase